MTKTRKIEMIVFTACMAGFAGYLMIDQWDRWFPDFEVGKCLRHQKTQRVYQLIADEKSSALDRGVPVRILETGIALPSEHIVGSEERIQVDDPKLRVVACPWEKN